ncbi:uncharacterized protein LOC105447342 [Strongylocentrotus purpuratus]|uniref:Sushi domain-containing protein n=1 Tax=Strongylocentrotus purpuratus TaxID=7668 RepID=A0A7M7PK31_STRPU|nr:uncharacterized protein LOC105447342 [Strongylocentrotus purpuratus]
MVYCKFNDASFFTFLFSEVICLLPNEPFSHVVMALSVYRGNDFVTIQCDDKEEYVIWQCNGTSGNWIQLANLDCRPEPEVRGLSTGVIIGIVIGIVVVIGMIFCFLYKMAYMKPRGHQGILNQGGDFVPQESRDTSGSTELTARPIRTDTLPPPPTFTPNHGIVPREPPRFIQISGFQVRENPGGDFVQPEIGDAPYCRQIIRTESET